MSTFAHRDLDGVFARLLGPALLEYRDPNDDQSPSPADKTRHQYTAVNGLLLVRQLPPESVGDRWRDLSTGKLARRAPDFTLITQEPDWPLLNDWLDHVLDPDQPHPWSTGGAMSMLPEASSITMTWLRSRIEIAGLDAWPQMIPCPHCCEWIVWAEACYVPGYRICRGCHRHWQADRPGETWVLRRTRGRGWPYRTTSAT